MERERRDGPEDDDARIGFMTSVPSSVGRGDPPAAETVPHLAPRPDKGLPFAEALDDAMREHRAVFAALAK